VGGGWNLDTDSAENSKIYAQTAKVPENIFLIEKLYLWVKRYSSNGGGEGSMIISSATSAYPKHSPPPPRQTKKWLLKFFCIVK